MPRQDPSLCSTPGRLCAVPISCTAATRAVHSPLLRGLTTQCYFYITSWHKRKMIPRLLGRNKTKCLDSAKTIHLLTKCLDTVHEHSFLPNNFCKTCPSYRSSAKSFTIILSPTNTSLIQSINTYVGNTNLAVLYTIHLQFKTHAIFLCRKNTKAAVAQNTLWHTFRSKQERLRKDSSEVAVPMHHKV